MIKYILATTALTTSIYACEFKPIESPNGVTDIVDMEPKRPIFDQSKYEVYHRNLVKYQCEQESELIKTVIPRIDKIKDTNIAKYGGMPDKNSRVQQVYFSDLMYAYRETKRETLIGMYNDIERYRRELLHRISDKYGIDLRKTEYKLDIYPNYMWIDGDIHNKYYVNEDESPVVFQLDIIDW